MNNSKEPKLQEVLTSLEKADESNNMDNFVEKKLNRKQRRYLEKQKKKLEKKLAKKKLKNKEEDKLDDIPLYMYLMPEKELDNTMFVYHQKPKLVDLKLYKVERSKKYPHFLEMMCLHNDIVPGWIYLKGFEESHKILVNQKTVDLIRQQEKTDKTDEELATLFIKYYGDISDVVLSLMGFNPIKMRKKREEKK